MMDITPPPDDEEVAAIVAALDAVAPRFAPVDADAMPRWRWSGRWWTKPIPLRRNRPW